MKVLNLSGVVRFKDRVRLEDEIYIGDIWKIGETVRLQAWGVITRAAFFSFLVCTRNKNP